MSELNEAKLKEIQSLLEPKNILIIKLTADWCQPCQKIKPICDDYLKKIPDSIKFIEIDIDESLDLYVKLKRYKMINGIPALLAYYGGTRDNWYVPNDSCLGGEVKKVQEFFERCISYASSN